MGKENLFKDYLSTNDKLLFEFYVYGKTNGQNTIINWLASILSGTSIDIFKHSYIIGVGNLNIYIIDLGIHIFPLKNERPKNVQVLDRKSITNIIIDNECLDITYTLKIQTKEYNKEFFTDCNKISSSQLNSLKLISKSII